MGKFERVKDPTRTLVGDLLVMPATSMLNLSLATLNKYGISMGGTCRSLNSRDTVAKWLVRRDTKPRVLLVASVFAPSQPSSDQSLIGLGAVKAAPPEAPLVDHADLVPFGPELWNWSSWAGCWNSVTDGSVARRLAELCGFAKVNTFYEGIRKNCTADLFASQVWDERPVLAGLAPGDRHDWDLTEDYVPAGPTCDGDIDAFTIDSLMYWEGGYDNKTARIQVPRGFLSKFAARGAVVVRPTKEFRQAVTDWCAGWCAGRLKERFARRTAASKFYMAGLKSDMARDAARARGLARQERRLERAGSHVPETLAKEVLA